MEPNVHVQQKELARREEHMSRNASRALRKAVGDANVSEDEGDEEESEASDSVNRNN
jgi:hypothetical protein